jgi:hypothetical protein
MCAHGGRRNLEGVTGDALDRMHADADSSELRRSVTSQHWRDGIARYAETGGVDAYNEKCPPAADS